MVHVNYNTDPLGKYKPKYNVVGPHESNKVHKGDTSGFIYIPANPVRNRK